MAHIVRKVKDANPREITCGIMRDLTTDKDSKGFDFVYVTIIDSTKEHYEGSWSEQRQPQIFFYGQSVIIGPWNIINVY